MAAQKTVRFELVPPATAFECVNPVTGELLRVEKDGFASDEPRVIAELDQQTHALRRAKKADS